MSRFLWFTVYMWHRYHRNGTAVPGGGDVTSLCQHIRYRIGSASVVSCAPFIVNPTCVSVHSTL